MNKEDNSLVKKEIPNDLHGLVTTENQDLFPTMTIEKVREITQRMVEMDRANHTAGRSRTATTAQLGSLNMLGSSPYRRLRQCLSEIEDRRKVLEFNYFEKLKRDERIRLWEERGDEMSRIRIMEAQHNEIRGSIYIEGALKEIAIFQEAYEEIRLAHDIPEDWDEVDFEKEEVRSNLRQAFKQAHRDVVGQGHIGVGNMEFLEQYGVHPATASHVVNDYVTSCHKQATEQGIIQSVQHLHDWLDFLCDTFADAHQDQVKDIGLKTLTREHLAYKELKEGNDDESN